MDSVKDLSLLVSVDIWCRSCKVTFQSLWGAMCGNLLQLVHVRVVVLFVEAPLDASCIWSTSLLRARSNLEPCKGFLATFVTGNWFEQFCRTQKVGWTCIHYVCWITSQAVQGPMLVSSKGLDHCQCNYQVNLVKGASLDVRKKGFPPLSA